MVMWTDDQRTAIEDRGSNLLVAAAAGSGKTAVLVERIKQLIIQDKIDIDQLLIVTFTNAAAGEMRARIGAAILEELEKKTEDEDHLRRQMNLLSKASISTLHSFCINVVRKYFHLIDIDPNFRIGDATETGIMKMESLEELFENQYEEEEEHFLGLVERFGGNKEDTPLQELVLKLFEFIQSKPYPMAWLAEKVEEFQLKPKDFEENPWVTTILEQVEISLIEAKTLFMKAERICKEPGGPEAYGGAISKDIATTENLILASKGGLGTFYSQLKEVSHDRLGRVGKDIDGELKERAKNLRDQGKEMIKDIAGNLVVKSPEEYGKDLNELYPYMVYLHKLVMTFDEIYHQKKLEKGIVDFNDLEHYVLSILNKEQVAQVYQKKFQYIFVDEYQDSNIVQETILGFIKRENNLFMVGDVKQSIYRFRLADPSLFMEKYETFGMEKGSLNRRVDLSKNFRSRQEIIHGINFIFKNIMTKSFGEMNYDEKAYLYNGIDPKPLKNPEIELNLVEKNYRDEEVEEVLEELEDMEAEARIVAKRIKELLSMELYDGKEDKYRRVTYRDMVVLLRTTRNWAKTFLETFIEEGIPAYADINTGYFETVEVNIFMNLLKIIDNKRQDIPLLSVMRSPIGGFDPEELIKIRIYSKENSYYGAIEDYIQDGEGPVKDKCNSFIQKLNRWKDEARYIHVDELIWKLFVETGYYDYVGAMPGGIQRQANLRILFDRARQFQRTSIKGLFNFIKFIDKLRDSSGDMGTAKTLGENDNVVRIMSIHKSKGLEFPIVITAAMGKQFNLRDTSEQVLFHKDLGIGPKYVDPNVRQYTDTLPKIAMKNKIKMESLAEEMRVLYVAFTRAKDKLILVGSVRDMENTAKRWTKNINPFSLSKGKSYLDWLGPVVIRHGDGGLLRQLAGFDPDEGFYLDDPSRWVINRFHKSDILRDEMEKNITRLAFIRFLKKFELSPPEGEREMVDQRLNWHYVHGAATKIPSKLSVTEIKRLSPNKMDSMGMNIPPLIKKPRFMEQKKQLSGVDRGIIIHFVMQHLDLNRIRTKEEIRDQIKRMVQIELMKDEDAAVVDVDKIMKFFESPIGRRVVMASHVKREVPFNFVNVASAVIPGLDHCQEKLLIQGVIDCYFEEEDGLVLVDYKTDYVHLNNKEEILDKYRTQVHLYGEALTKITKKTVKESYLYLFHLDEEVKL